MRMGKTKLPAAVPDTQIPFANARRLLKYMDTMMIPGVVDKPPPIPAGKFAILSIQYNGQLLESN